MTWGSNSTSRTSSAAWKKIRRDALKRANNCCEQCGNTGVALFCDHIRNVAEGGTDTLDNAQILCGTCHDPKTRAESTRGIARRKARRHRRQQPHPCHTPRQGG